MPLQCYTIGYILYYYVRVRVYIIMFYVYAQQTLHYTRERVSIYVRIRRMYYVRTACVIIL